MWTLVLSNLFAHKCTVHSYNLCIRIIENPHHSLFNFKQFPNFTPHVMETFTFITPRDSLANESAFGSIFRIESTEMLSWSLHFSSCWNFIVLENKSHDASHNSSVLRISVTRNKWEHDAINWWRHKYMWNIIPIIMWWISCGRFYFDGNQACMWTDLHIILRFQRCSFKCSPSYLSCVRSSVQWRIDKHVHWTRMGKW